MSPKTTKSFVELAELIRANVSGPVKEQMIIKAQQRLVEKLKQRGVLSLDEANALLAS